MKYLLILILLLNSNLSSMAATETPGSARAALTKALNSESWTLDQVKLRLHVIVLDHPSARKQIVMTQESITFLDYGTDQETRTSGVLHPSFFEETLASFGVVPTPITPTLDSWVE